LINFKQTKKKNKPLHIFFCLPCIVSQMSELHGLVQRKQDDQDQADIEISSFNDDLAQKLAFAEQIVAGLREQLSRCDAAVAQARLEKDIEWAQKLEIAVRRARDDTTSTLRKQFNSKLAQQDFVTTQRLQEMHEEVLDSKDAAYQSLKTRFDAMAEAFDDMKIELGDCQDNIVLTDVEHKYDIQALKHQLDRHSDLNVKQREARLISKFEAVYKRNNRRRKIPAYAAFLIRDYITNTCLNDLSQRPLMVSRVAVELGHTKLNLQDLLKVGKIASGIHLREKGHRPPKALHCSGGKMRIDVCIYMEEDRWMVEEAFKQFTGKDNGW